MENKLDRFFKHKLNERQFPYQEAYWESALSAIKERDARRRRRFFWWISTGGALIVALALAVWLMLPGEATTHISYFPIEREAGPATDWIVASGDQLSLTPATPSSSIGSETGTFESKSTLNQKIPKIPASASVDQTATKTINNSTEHTPQAWTATTDEQKTNTLSKEAMKTERPASLQAGIEQESPTADAPASFPPNEVETEVDRAAEPVQQVRKWNEPVEVLPTVPFTPQESFGTERFAFALATPGRANNPPSPKLRREKPVTLWTEGGLSFYPFLPEEVNHWTGAQLGFLLRYVLMDKISLWGGLGYELRRSDFLPVDSSLQRSFSFGLEEAQYQLRPTSLHRARLYLGGQWNVSGKHHLEAGIAPSLLLVAMGRVEQQVYQAPWQRSQAENSSHDLSVRAFYENLPDTLSGISAAPIFLSDPEVISSGQMEAKGLLQILQFDISLGYEYAWNSWLRTGLRVNWRMTDFYKQQTGTNESNPFLLGIQFRARLK